MSRRNLKISVLLFNIFFPAVLVFLPYIYNLKNAFLTSVGVFFSYIAIVEISFRVYYRIRYKKPYMPIPKIPFDKMYIEPHPYLPYVYKKNFICQKEMPSTYPLHKEKGYRFIQLKTNNRRHINGPQGDRDIEVPKPEGLIRINCLGGSVTGNYICYENKNYSYPMELEKILQRAFPKVNIEVNNCGQGGYTSAEILIKFLLDTIDTRPDIVVICHAYNDLGLSLTANFQPDYSHARRNLGETYHLYRLASKIPAIPLSSWNYLVNYLIFSQNIRFSLVDSVSRGKPDIKNDFQGLSTYRRNMEHIINICKANGIFVVLSTMCCYLYDQVKNSETHLKYREGSRLENDVVRSVAAKHNIPLVDNASLVPQEDGYFVDTIHLTPEGMQRMAGNISYPIIKYIKTLGSPSSFSKQDAA